MTDKYKDGEIIEVRIDPLLPFFLDAIITLEELTEIVDSWMPKEKDNDRT